MASLKTTKATNSGKSPWRQSMTRELRFYYKVTPWLVGVAGFGLAFRVAEWAWSLVCLWWGAQQP